ncbi:fibrinogen-like protein 1 [Haliotis rufescens]|uniref:fibrinogen-like protein 1 n=1 Tax=Haliotis rufescens TaxID=6454 RepID=UPI00201E75C6|nr:fibrinogen-like protein 1 [Haliotis rufescens]
MAGDNCDMYYEDCSAAFAAGLTVPGHIEVIQIKPLDVIAPFFAKCYLGDGGYTYIEERNPSCDTDFMNRQYDDYDIGFGDVGGCSSFLGLNKIEKILKSESYKLDVEIVGDGFSGHAYYSKFFLKGSSDKYEVSWDVFSSDDLE